jgi:pimeloyl-ACP methyl ester carboxylesterase
MPITIVLVHGAFAGTTSWERVIAPLQSAGHRVIAAATPLRGLASDAAAIDDLVRGLDGPVALVGHSYGGAVISNVDPGAGDIVALAYVAGFAPAPGESCITLIGMCPRSTLGRTLQPVLRSDGATDLSIAADRFRDQFAGDVPHAQARRMAATQRPVAQEALGAPSTERPLWRERPSWFVFGAEDRTIPAALARYMAERAGARGVVEIPGASHALSVAHPRATAELILAAASSGRTGHSTGDPPGRDAGGARAGLPACPPPMMSSLPTPGTPPRSR